MVARRRGRRNMTVAGSSFVMHAYSAVCNKTDSRFQQIGLLVPAFVMSAIVVGQRTPQIGCRFQQIGLLVPASHNHHGSRPPCQFQHAAMPVPARGRSSSSANNLHLRIWRKKSLPHLRHCSSCPPVRAMSSTLNQRQLEGGGNRKLLEATREEGSVSCHSRQKNCSLHDHVVDIVFVAMPPS